MPGLQAGEPQQAAHEQVHEPDDRIGEAQQRCQHEGRGEGDLLGIRRADHLGRDLAEHQDHEGDDQRRRGEREFGFAEEAERQVGHERGRCRIDQVVPEQHDTQQAVGAGEELGRQAGTAMPGLHEVLKPIAVERHHAGLGDREEPGDHEEDDQREQQGVGGGVVQGVVS
jgi:hypothetical protein